MNNEKRLLLALAFSFIILAFWSNFAVKPRNSPNPQSYPQESTNTTKSEEQVLPRLPAPVCVPAVFYEFKHVNNKFIFAEPQGALSEVVFGNYQGYSFALKNSLQIGDPGMSFEREIVGNNSVTYTYQDKQKKIVKRFVFPKSGYVFDLFLSVENLPAPLFYLNCR